MDAQERAQKVIGLWLDARGIDTVIPWEENLRYHVTEQIRQAEQAVREQALEEAAQIAFDSDADGCAPGCYCGGGCRSGASAARNEIEEAIRALKTKKAPEKEVA